MKSKIIYAIESVVGILLVLILAYLMYRLFFPMIVNAEEDFCKKKGITQEDIKVEIIRQSLNADVNIYTALRIAKCESNYNPIAKNKSSSASGIYQFLNSTWSRSCSGDVFNYKDNISCFMKFYKKYPHWWVCK